MANKFDGTSGADSIIGTVADDDIWGFGGADTISAGLGQDRVYGGFGDDTYVVTDRWDVLFESGGTDTAVVSADFVKRAAGIEQWILQPGFKELPYWVDAVVSEEAIFAQRWFDSIPTFFYAFPTVAPDYLTQTDARSWTSLNGKQISAVRDALAYLESVIGLRFQETSDLAQANVIAFATNAQVDSAAYAYFPDDEIWGSDLFLDNSRLNLDARTNSYFALTLMHEIGHALGLKHPFDDADSGRLSEGPFLMSREETTKWTVMSYNHWPPYSLSLAPFDIAALQYLYGPSPSSRAGNDRYLLDGGPSQMIWDGGGTDVIDGSALRLPLHLSLEDGVWSWIGLAKGSLISQDAQVTININSLIENAIGGDGDDWLHGNSLPNTIQADSGNDTLIGSLGADSLDGGDGLDWALYNQSVLSVSVKAGPTGASPQNSSIHVHELNESLWFVGAEGDQDRLVDVERIVFSDAAIATDFNGSAGEAYRLLSLLFGQATMSTELLGLAIHLFDHGWKWQDLVNTAVATEQFLPKQGDVDVYAAGQVVWENLTGAAPGESDMFIIEQTLLAFSEDFAAWLAWLSKLPIVESIILPTEVRLSGILFAPWDG